MENLKFEISLFNKKTKKLWEDLYNLSKESPFLHVNGIKSIATISNTITRKSRLRFFIVYSCDKPIAIFPYRINGKILTLSGYTEGISFCSCNYVPEYFNEEIVDLFLNYFKSKGIKKFLWGKLFPNSKLDEILKRLNEEKYSIEESHYVCVTIKYNYETVDDYFKNLSKSTRQNIRTSYNRLKKDNLEYKNEIFFYKDNEYPTKPQKKQCKIIYQKRLKTKHSMMFIHRLFRKFFHYTIKLTKTKEIGFRSIFTINNKVAGFFEGLYCEKRNKIYVPKLAINSDFGFYSPGYLMIYETIKTLFPMGIKELDITFGEEKYKYDMGGESYIVPNYIVSVK